jgi:TIR domain-containing protein
MVSELKKALEVFFAYSHRDQDLRDQLETHLSLLKRQGFISNWHDRKIIAGMEWDSEIDAHLNSAQIILLLISADFLASAYCYDIEVKRAMERHNAGEARVIPIILRPCDWHTAPFGKLQALPTDGKPVDSRYWYSKDEAFYDVTQGIRKTVQDLQALKTPAKVQNDRSGDFSKTDVKLTLPKPKVSKAFNLYEVRDEWIEYITSNLKEAVEREDALNFYTNDAQGHRQIRILSGQKTVYSLDIFKGSMGGSSGDEGISFSYTEGRVTYSSGFHASGSFKWDRQKEVVVLELLDISLLLHLGGTKEYTKEEFLHALWDKIRSVIERSSC